MGDPDESWVPTDLAFSWRLLHQNGAQAPTVEPNPMKYRMQILEAAAECEARFWRLAPLRSRDEVTAGPRAASAREAVRGRIANVEKQGAGHAE